MTDPLRGATGGIFPTRLPRAWASQAGVESDAPVGPARGSHGGPRDRSFADAYDEEAFRCLLAIEHKRSERCGRPYLLLLVHMQDHSGRSVPIDAPVVATIFAGLRCSLRETDAVGWYVVDRVVGAVLTDLGDGPRSAVCATILQTVRGALGEQLPPDVARRIHVRAYQYPDIDGIEVENL